MLGQVLNDEMFAILVLMALFTTFITTPSVMAIYEPARGISATTRRRLCDFSSSSKKKAAGDLRVLACVHGPGNVPSSINRLIELIRSTKNSLLKRFIMHPVELTERSSSIVLTQRARKNGFPFLDRFYGGLARAFQAYRQCGRVSVRPSTAISSLSTMHEYICHVAERKRVTLIILPFHKQWRMEMEEEEIGNRRHEIMDNVGHGWRGVNQRVLKNSPCSVAVLVDRGFGNGSAGTTPNVVDHHRVCILFFGGPDDREALELGGRMAEHTEVKVTVVRFVGGRNGLASDGVVLRPSPNKCCEKSYTFSTATMNHEKEQGLDETAVEEFRKKWHKAVYQEKTASNIVEEVLRIGQSGEYDLIVVGKGRFPSRMVAEMAERQAEHAELGPIGDILASSGQAVVSSVLVIQQHDVELAEYLRSDPTPRAPFGEHCESSSVGEGNSTSNDNNV